MKLVSVPTYAKTELILEQARAMLYQHVLVGTIRTAMCYVQGDLIKSINFKIE